MRPSSGRMRGYHSVSGAFAVGGTIAAFGIIIFIMLGAG